MVTKYQTALVINKIRFFQFSSKSILEAYTGFIRNVKRADDAIRVARGIKPAFDRFLQVGEYSIYICSFLLGTKGFFVRILRLELDIKKGLKILAFAIKVKKLNFHIIKQTNKQIYCRKKHIGCNILIFFQKNKIIKCVLCPKMH